MSRNAGTSVAKLFSGLVSIFACLVFVVLPFSSQAQTVRLGIEVENPVHTSCLVGDVRVNLRLENPGGFSLGGYQFLLEYPAETLVPVAFEPGDFGSEGAVNLVNGAAPFGPGFEGCPNEQADPWADGLGLDRALALGSVFSEHRQEALTASSIHVGAFLFQFQAGVTPGEFVVSLPDGGCDARFQQGVFGDNGRFLGVLFDSLSADLIVQESLVVTDLSCQSSENGVQLEWSDPPGFGRDFLYRVYRNGEVLFPAVFYFGARPLDSSPPCGLSEYEVAILAGGQELPCRSRCVVEFEPNEFLRGDANSDGRVNLTDATRVTLFFNGIRRPECDDAADANDDGRVDLSDAVMILSFLFLAGPGILPEPAGSPGRDPSDDDGLCCERGTPDDV